jgi:hypothetical protein
MSVTYLRDGKEFSTRELVATYYKGVSLPQGYDFSKENTIVFPSPKPECGELEQAVRDGVTIDADGNTVQAWKVVDMFNDYQAETKDTDGEQVYDADGNKVYHTVTKAEQEADYLQAKFKATVPDVISMRQARLALLNAGLLTTVESAIANGTDEAMKIEWEYATEVRRDWESLITMATSLGMSELDLDNLFITGGKL